MDFDFDTGTIYGGLATLDVSTNPPLGSGPANVLTIIANGAITLPQGPATDRPAAAGGTDIAGMFRYNTAINQLEYFDSTTWQQLTSSAGSVSSFQTSLSGLTPSTATTGAVTLGGILGATSGGTGTSTAPIAGQFLYSTSGATYSATTLDGIAVTTFSAGSTGFTPGTATSGDITLGGTLVLANGGTSASLTAVAGAPVYSTAGALAIGTAGTTGQAYISGGTSTPTWQTVSSDVDANPGAILSSTASGAFTASGATFIGSGSYSGVTLSGTPTNGTDATTKDYVDSLANGLSWKQSVRVATTVNGDLANDFEAGDTIDGVVLATNDRILIKNQTAQEENGIYIVQATGAPVRSEDMDSTTPVNEVNGAAVFVENGTALADTAWVQTATVTTIGTDPIVWAQFGGPGSYTAGNGLTLSGNQFSLTSPVSVDNGGTALSATPTNGQLLIGNGAGYTLGGLTAGTGISIVPGAGTITIATTASGVTSVTGTANQITASPTVGDVVVSLPSTLIAPGSLQVTTSFTVDTFTPNSALYVTTGGQVVSSAALTDGQILIGSTGNPPVAGTITGGSGINVTNTAGTITIDVDDTELVTSFSAGTTGLTPATPGVGDVVLAGILNAANGGTGLDTSTATNGQILIGNGSGLSLATLTQGTGITIANGAGSVSITNSGVTGFSLNDNSAAPIYAVTPISSATGAVAATITLNTQSVNTVFAGPATGPSAEPTFRALTAADLGTALQLYVENPSTPTTPVASGTNSVAIGSGAEASAAGSFAVGQSSVARIFGQKAFANGSTNSAGDAQAGLYVLRNVTTDNTWTEVFLDGTAGVERIVLPNNSVFTFEIIVAGRRTDATGGGAGYRFIGVAMKDATNGSMTFVGTPSKTVIGETNGAWDSRVTTDTTNGAIRVEIRGENSKDISWTAVVRTAEVTN